MKICVTSQGDALDSEVDPRFGRCRYFVFAEMDDQNIEILQNPHIDSAGGAGINAARFVVEKKVHVVLTGNVGPNAFRTLEAAGVKVVTGVSGSIRNVIDTYKKGEYKTGEGPNVQSHFGMP